ncbi:hypothetical protein BH23ACT11_BH23ACT11_26190 [soil metagenome]
MRQSTLSIAVVFLSALVASLILLLVSQAASEARTPSQGVLVKGPKLPDEDFPAYSRTVDNSSSKRLRAPGWQSSSRGTDIYGADYLTSDGAKRPARYKFRIPANDTYSVFAWWPAKARAASSVRFKIRTGKKREVEIVNQRRDAGYWVPIGQYEMRKGTRYAVEISANTRRTGKAIADAVAIVRGVESFPAEAPTIGKNSETARSDTEASKDVMVSGMVAGRRIPRRALMRRAKSRLGQPYDYNHRRCRARARAVDCSCLTRLVYMKWRRLPDHPRYQWYRVKHLSTKFKRRRPLRRGDLTFFDEDRDGRLEAHDSVSIYAGNGKVIMASGYFGKVAVIEMKYIYGYWGGKRLRY